MKKARSNVVGAKSPENSSASSAFPRSAMRGKREDGSRPSARRSSSASGGGRGPRSPVVLVTCADATPGSGSEPSGARPVSTSSNTSPRA